MLMVYLPMQPSSLYDFVGSDDGVTPRLQGQTTAVELPADAGGYVGVVPWQRLSWHNVTLPPNVGSRWPQVLESLLEEDLLQPPQQVHLVCGPGSALALRQGGHVVVCACDKPWLRSVLEPLQMAGTRLIDGSNAGGANDTGFKTSIQAEPRSNALILRSANPARQAQVRSLTRYSGAPCNGRLCSSRCSLLPWGEW